MARVLWCSVETPAQDGQGGQRRQYHQISALLNRGHDITVLVPTSGQPDRSIRRLVPVIRPRVDFAGRMLESRIRRMRRLVGDPRWDAVIVSHQESIWLLPERPAARVLVDVHNVMTYWLSRTDRHDDLRAAAEWEDRALLVSDAAMTCSATELRRLDAMHPGAAETSFAAPIGVDPSEWPTLGFSRDEPRVALFGSWAWDPNRAGLEWFLREVWPRVTDRQPDAIGLVAGSGVDDSSGWPDGLRFLGRVDDLAAFTAAAAVVAVPVLDGVGASVKFTEALASGSAVIATSDGANAIDDPPAHVSDDPEDWADWIADRLAHRADEPAPDPARAIALTELTWDRAVEPIDSWLRAAVRAPSIRPGAT